mmetsp:Transcript_73839/g.130191  ORF Transcript_73839/g.130191 Transcript_73839/m.130191 type:complete len:247 (+) Transcript_73839:1895-2635(+)
MCLQLWHCICARLAMDLGPGGGSRCDEQWASQACTPLVVFVFKECTWPLVHSSTAAAHHGLLLPRHQVRVCGSFRDFQGSRGDGLWAGQACSPFPSSSWRLAASFAFSRAATSFGGRRHPRPQYLQKKYAWPRLPRRRDQWAVWVQRPPKWMGNLPSGRPLFFTFCFSSGAESLCLTSAALETSWAMAGAGAAAGRGLPSAGLRSSSRLETSSKLATNMGASNMSRLPAFGTSKGLTGLSVWLSML